jgi:hypothetical protein
MKKADLLPKSLRNTLICQQARLTAQAALQNCKKVAFLCIQECPKLAE